MMEHISNAVKAWQGGFFAPARQVLPGEFGKARKESVLSLSPGAWGNWVLQEGRLSHSNVDFFQVVAISDSNGGVEFRLAQSNGAVVALLFKFEPDGSRSFLVQIRPEPGLIGGVAVTATIQSTWNNLRAEHGGSKPFLADLISAPLDFGEVIHNSHQWDWLDLYNEKSKYFLIVRTEYPVQESPLHFWITENELRSLALEPHLLSSDRMAAVALLFASDVVSLTSIPPEEGAEPTDLAIETPGPLIPITDKLRVDDQRLTFADFSDSRGRQVIFVNYGSSVREVNRWIQPLLLLPRDKHINVALSGDSGYSISLDFRPAKCATREMPAAHSKISREQFQSRLDRLRGNEWKSTLHFSAEGGRFFRHEISLSGQFGDYRFLPRGSRPTDVHRAVVVASRRALEDRRTSLEFRLGLFLLWVRIHDET